VVAELVASPTTPRHSCRKHSDGLGDCTIRLRSGSGSDRLSLLSLHVVGIPFKSQSEWLKPKTTYHGRVKSRDASGNLAASDDVTFTTP